MRGIKIVNPRIVLDEGVGLRCRAWRKLERGLIARRRRRRLLQQVAVLALVAAGAGRRAQVRIDH